MRIGIDYTAAVLQGTRGLVDALLPLLDPADHLTLLHPREASLPTRPDWPAAVHHRRLPLPDRLQTILWHRLRLPIPVDYFTGPLDIFHAPNFLLPPVRRARTLVTIHDLAFLVRPHFAHPDLQRFLARAIPRSLAGADHILADSEASRQDAIRLFQLPPERITVVGAGVETRFRPATDSQSLHEIHRKYNLPAVPFVLTLSTLEPRKNIDGLIRAFVAARQRAALAHHLVIAGKPGWLYESIYNEVARLHAGDFVHFLGFVADADLPALYNLAELFAFPSHYEGFGLPVLEALACGRPVLCTDTSSLPEITGDAARLVPAGDEAALTLALAELLTDPAALAELARRGPAQAAAWTWEAAARRLLEVYRRQNG
jgi:glycosyltransferase involved in cell wall biosynthesis